MAEHGIVDDSVHGELGLEGTGQLSLGLCVIMSPSYVSGFLGKGLGCKWQSCRSFLTMLGVWSRTEADRCWFFTKLEAELGELHEGAELDGGVVQDG